MIPQTRMSGKWLGHSSKKTPAALLYRTAAGHLFHGSNFGGPSSGGLVAAAQTRQALEKDLQIPGRDAPERLIRCLAHCGGGFRSQAASPDGQIDPSLPAVLPKWPAGDDPLLLELPQIVGDHRAGVAQRLREVCGRDFLKYPQDPPDVLHARGKDTGGQAPGGAPGHGALRQLKHVVYAARRRLDAPAFCCGPAAAFTKRLRLHHAFLLPTPPLKNQRPRRRPFRSRGAWPGTVSAYMR